MTEVPFTSERKRMSVICKTAPSQAHHLGFTQPYALFMKGSPELVWNNVTKYKFRQLFRE
ncbi:hypothetical protein I1H34_26940 (plasmid) [Acaryochloris marina S15]|nr:hypothetical protein I1H34_26940 [Acaryochloris marina S15]